jgi:hypothetical protein
MKIAQFPDIPGGSPRYSTINFVTPFSEARTNHEHSSSFARPRKYGKKQNPMNCIRYRTITVRFLNAAAERMFNPREVTSMVDRGETPVFKKQIVKFL